MNLPEHTVGYSLPFFNIPIPQHTTRFGHHAKLRSTTQTALTARGGHSRIILYPGRYPDRIFGISNMEELRWQCLTVL